MPKGKRELMPKGKGEPLTKGETTCVYLLTYILPEVGGYYSSLHLVWEGQVEKVFQPLQ